MKTIQHMIIDKGQLVPLTAAWLKEKVKDNQRIDLILTFAALSHAHLVKVIPLVNNTKMSENKVLELFSPWLNPKPVIPSWHKTLRQTILQHSSRLFHRPIQPLCKTIQPPDWGQFST